MLEDSSYFLPVEQKKYRRTSLTKKNKHQTMSKDNKTALIRQSLGGVFDYNGQSYTYHPLDKFLSRRYVYVSSLWIIMIEN